MVRCNHCAKSFSGGMLRAAKKHISTCVNLFKHAPMVKPDHLALIWYLDRSFLASHMPPFGVYQRILAYFSVFRRILAYIGVFRRISAYLVDICPNKNIFRDFFTVTSLDKCLDAKSMKSAQSTFSSRTWPKTHPIYAEKMRIYVYTAYMAWETGVYGHPIRK